MAAEHSSSSSRTFFARKDVPQRRHLAPNVVCMFNEDRPAVQQVPRRGRYPKVVATMHDARSRRYLASLPKPVDYQLGDRVEVNLTHAGWHEAVIAGFAQPFSNGERRFRVIAEGCLFSFSDSLEMSCTVGDSRLRLR